MKRYGFLAVGRVNRWQVEFPENDTPDVFDSKGEAESARAEWSTRGLADLRKEFEKAAAQRGEERKQFIAATKVEIVTVNNPKVFQADHRKPTVKFPDGSEDQFEEGTSAEAIKSYIEDKAMEAYPKVDQADYAKENEREKAPKIEEVRSWEAKLFLDGEPRPLPDINVWEFYYPMQTVAEMLNSLADQGWEVMHVSEDRGLYSNSIVRNMSAPVVVRYLLAREQAADD